MRKLSIPLLALAAVAVTAFVSMSAAADGAARSNQFWWPEQLNLAPVAPACGGI